MNQEKIGSFLKELRTGKSLTQQEAADQLYVSVRTISRWENGRSMPDLDMLVLLAQFYEVDLIEILNGAYKQSNMNEQEKETMEKVSDYARERQEKLKKRITWIFAGAFISLGIFSIMLFNGTADIPGWQEDLASACLGLSFGLCLAGCFVTSPLGERFSLAKREMLKKSIASRS